MTGDVSVGVKARDVDSVQKILHRLNGVCGDGPKGNRQQRERIH